jgi:hypothetical protein
MWYAVAAVVVLLLAYWVYSRVRAYRRIFATKSFLEIARRLPAAKEAAIARADEAPGEMNPLEDPRAIITDAPMAVFYTVEQIGRQYRHQLSLSVPGYTAHTVGDQFLRWILHLLEVDLDECELLVLPSSVHFIQWMYEADRQARYNAERLPVDDLVGELAAFFKVWRESGLSDRWQRQLPRRG